MKIGTVPTGQMAGRQQEQARIQQQSAGLNRFADLLQKKQLNNREDQKLRDACVDMESVLLKQMLTVMRKTVKKSGLLDGGNAEEIFTDMLYGEYAKKMANNHSFGLAKVMYSQLTHGKTWDSR